MSSSVRLQLGCGNDPKPGWINHDLVQLEGVEIVHDLNNRPWPWADNSIDEIWAKDVLEHLPDTLATMEELYRITKPGASVYIAVPYWNSWEAITDPTHVRQFNEFTLIFLILPKNNAKNDLITQMLALQSTKLDSESKPTHTFTPKKE